MADDLLEPQISLDEFQQVLEGCALRLAAGWFPDSSAVVIRKGYSVHAPDRTERGRPPKVSADGE
jgi:hypothetical protein